MAKHIAIIQGHPDSTVRHFCHALADEYAKGAEDGGHDVMRIDVATLDFPLLRTKQDFEKDRPPEAIKRVQDIVAWADHLVIIYPLWLGSMPALLQGFLEQLLRPGFAFEYQKSGGIAKKLLKGKSARIVVTMGMPAFVYRWIFFAHSLKSLTRNTLWFCGIGPVKSTIIGSIEGLTDRQRADWLDEMRGLGDVGK
ncbi:MAG TPA: NAD(P)H-dependent oxidoreductase [Nitrospira sp.]